ncbi:MAG: hypothetical protein AB7E79_16645 [Rhodospirillaceae bacterium]
MSGEPKKYVFKINSYTPDTLPMGRLAEYMAELAKMLGETGSVHFVNVTEGSAKLRAKVDYEAIPKVEHRVQAVRRGTGPTDAQNASHRLNQMLAQDNTDGEFGEDEGATIIEFPGGKAKKDQDYGLVHQATVLEGIVRRVGGKQNDKASVILETPEGFETHCETTRETSRILAKFYDGPTLRLTGQGTWRRGEQGWSLVRFVISGYEEIDQRSLLEVVPELQNVPNAGWKTVDDPWRELRDIRDGDGNA